MKQLIRLQRQADLHAQSASLHQQLSRLQWRRLTSGLPSAATVLPFAAIGLFGAVVARSSKAAKSGESKSGESKSGESRATPILENIVERLKHLDETFSDRIDGLNQAAEDLQEQAQPAELPSKSQVLASAVTSLATRLLFSEVQPLYNSLKSSVLDTLAAESQSSELKVPNHKFGAPPYPYQ